METKRKSLLKRTVALLLTICSLLAVMVPVVSAEEAAGSEGAEEPVMDFEILTGAVVGEFSFNDSCYGAVSVVNGHDYLYIPHHEYLFVYDLDTWEKVDEEILGWQNGYGCFVDSNGIVWAYGVSSRMLRYDPVTGESSFTSETGIEGANSILDVIEVNGKLYLGTYSKPKLVEYDPATDTFTDLGVLSSDAAAKSAGTLNYKDGYIYATVTSTKETNPPHYVVKYDLANKKIVDTLDIFDNKLYHKDKSIRGAVIVGNLLFTASKNPVGMFAVDISGEKMKIVTGEELGHEITRGVQNGFSEVIVEKDEAGNVINEKVYFMSGTRKSVKPMGWTSEAYIYEYNSSTNKITRVEAFKDMEKTPVWPHTKDGCIVTVGQEITGIEGWEGPSLMTFDQAGLVYLFNFASGKVWTDTTLTFGDGSGKDINCTKAGPDGVNTIAMGNYTSNIFSVYDIETGKMKQFPGSVGQVCQIHYTQDGKCYASGYDAISLAEINVETGEAKLMFEMDDTPEHNYAFLQERPYNMTSGGGKLFVTTAPDKGFLGGYLLWYDFDKQATYVAVESDKVLYLKDSDKTTWYDAKNDAPVVFTYTDGATRNFTGLVTDQIPKSIVYQDGYIYGGTGINGGSSATPAEGASAVLFAYDVANMKLVTLDIRTAIEGLPEIVDTIYAVAADPAVPGKFWGQVGGTLFSFTYDKTTGTFDVKEELSFSKNNCYLFMNVWTGGPMVIEDGFIIADLRDEAALEAGNRQFRMISTEDPSYNVLLLETAHKHFALAEDNNIYMATADGRLGRYNTANRIAEIKANKPAKDAAEEKINAIGEVTLESEEAIVAARAAYDALPEEVKALVSNLDVLTAAETKFAELKAAAEKAAADKAAADAVIAKIEAIGEVTLESEEDIKAARAAYDALTDDQKALVDAAKLTAAESKYAELKAAAEKAAADKAAADAVAAKIEAIGEVTLESEEDIKAARAAYDALTADQKALVDVAKLTAAEEKLSELQTAAAEKAAADKAAADAVTAKIEAIGKVTLKSEEAIKAAREAYDALTAEQKALVDATKLTAAESALEALKKPADPDNPKTGDETNLVLPVVLMVVSVMGIAAGVVCTQKFSYKGKHVK